MLPMSQLVIPKSFDSCFTYEKQILWLKRKIEELEESGGGSPELDEIKERLDRVEQALSNDEGDISTLQTNVTDLDTRLDTVEGDISTLQTNVTDLDTRLDTVEGNLSTDEGKISNMQTSIADLEEYCAYLEFYAVNFRMVRNYNYGFKSRVGIMANGLIKYGMQGIDVRAVVDCTYAVPWNNSGSTISSKYTMTGKLTVRGMCNNIEYEQGSNVWRFDCVDIPIEDVVGANVNIKLKNDNALSMFVRVYGVKNGVKTLIGEDNDTFTVSVQTDTYNGVDYNVFRFNNSTGPTLELDHQGDTYDSFTVEFTTTLPFIAYKNEMFYANALSTQPSNN